MVGRLSKEKRSYYFLKCLKILTEKIKLESVILGSGNQEDIIKKMIYEYKLDKKVKMISHKNNPYPYIKQSNILVLCSLHEGLPNVLMNLQF